MSMGLQAAYGAQSVREALKQRLLDQIAEQERTRKGGLEERRMKLDEQESAQRAALMTQNAEDRKLAQTEAARSRDEAGAMRSVALRPPGTDVTPDEYKRETGFNVPTGLYTPKGVQEPAPPESLTAEPTTRMSGSLRMIPDTLANSVEPAKQAFTFRGTQDQLAKEDALKARGEEAQASRDAMTARTDADRAAAQERATADREMRLMIAKLGAGNTAETRSLANQLKQVQIDAAKAKLEGETNDRTQKENSARESTQTALDSIDKLQKHPAIDAATGAFELRNIGGGLTQDVVDFNAERDMLIAALTLPNLGALKGPMSDKDVIFVKQLATKLGNKRLSKEAFQGELARAKAFLKNKLGPQGGDVGDTGGVRILSITPKK